MDRTGCKFGVKIQSKNLLLVLFSFSESLSSGDEVHTSSEIHTRSPQLLFSFLPQRVYFSIYKAQKAPPLYTFSISRHPRSFVTVLLLDILFYCQFTI